MMGSARKLVALLNEGAEGSGPDGCQGAGVRWEGTRSVGAFLGALKAHRPAFALLSSGVEGVDAPFAERVAESLRQEEGGILLASPRASLEWAVAALRLGAGTLLSEPLDAGEVAAELRRRMEPEDGIRIPVAPKDLGVPGMVGAGPVMMEIVRSVARIGGSPSPVLVTGESGTGKELVARALHWAGPRKDRDFVAINCAAVPEALLESEFFGHEKGAFTGAVVRRRGRFERADGGTLFLDEVGDMSLVLQSKLLRVLEEGEVERVGAEEPISVDVRIIAATNRELDARVAEGDFREDLFFRLAVSRIHVPPLRERKEELEELVFHFIRTFSARYENPVLGVSREAFERLREHDWPGNVRELRNVVDRAVLLARGGWIRAEDLQIGEEAPRVSSAGLPRRERGYPPTTTLEAVERDHIARVLAHTSGGISRSAELLGIHRNTLSRKIRRFGLDSGDGGGVDGDEPR